MDEHRFVVEQALGRKLSRFELVHHINGDKRDNRLENLRVVSPKEHARLHGMWKHPVSWECEFCGRLFTPHPTKRGGKKRTCSTECRYKRVSLLFRNPRKPRSIYRKTASPSEVKLRRPA